MSWQAVRWALDDAPVTDTTRTLVLVAIAERADEHGRNARPSVGTIARRAKISPRSVHPHMRALEADGLIRRTGVAARGVVIYAVTMDATCEVPTTDGVQPASQVGVQPASHQVCSPPHTNHPGTPEQPPGTTPRRRDATTADADDRADALTKAWWESFDPRPSGSFVGFRTLIRSLLRAGWEDAQVLDAARACGPTFNRASIEKALRAGSRHRIGYRNSDEHTGAVITVDEWRNHVG